MSPLAGRFLGRDPLGLSPDYNTFRYTNGNPIKWYDPFGLEVPDYDTGDVNNCIRLLQAVVVGTSIIEGIQGVATMPCARSLLQRFLAGNQTGTTCTTECQTALQNYNWSDRLSEFAGHEVEQQMNCEESKRIDLSNLQFEFRNGVPAFEKDDTADLYYAFHEFTMSTFSAACQVSCGKATGCCCSCTGNCGAEIVVKDDYDFCSSYRPNVGKFAKCGCIIEDYRKRSGGSGGIFKLNCPAGMRQGKLSTNICYPKKPPHLNPVTPRQ
jgi:hypothetical protein